MIKERAAKKQKRPKIKEASWAWREGTIQCFISGPGVWVACTESQLDPLMPLFNKGQGEAMTLFCAILNGTKPIPAKVELPLAVVANMVQRGIRGQARAPFWKPIKKIMRIWNGS